MYRISTLVEDPIVRFSNDFPIDSIGFPMIHFERHFAPERSEGIKSKSATKNLAQRVRERNIG